MFWVAFDLVLAVVPLKDAIGLENNYFWAFQKNNYFFKWPKKNVNPNATFNGITVMAYQKLLKTIETTHLK